MSSKSSSSSTCSCLSDDASIVDYSEAEQILQDVKADLKSIQNDMKTILSKSCAPDHTSRACKVSSVLVKLQSVDSRLLQIINLMEPENVQAVIDLVSNFGMTVKLDIARNKLNGLKSKHAELRREWHSQDIHLNRIAKDVAKKETELKYQSVFCTTQGYVLSKMLWKLSKCDCLLEIMLSEEKLVLELIQTLDGCLYAFTRTYQKEMPESTADEYQYVLCLCGVLSNLASIPDGRFFLINQPACRDMYDQLIKALSKILVPKAENLKWILLVAIYNIMICKEGREYAKNNQYLLQSLAECISPPHSNKIIIIALKIIGNLTNDPNKAYIAHISSFLPIGRLSELQQSRDSCTIRKQARQILSSMEPEALLHTIQLEHSRSRCNFACTQTASKKKPEILAYYVFTDTSLRVSERTSSVNSTTTSWSGSEDRLPGSPKSEFEVSDSFLHPKFSQRPQPNSAPTSSYEHEALECKLKSASAYHTKQPGQLSVSVLPYRMEDTSTCSSPLLTACFYMEDASQTISAVQMRSVHPEDLQEPTLPSNSQDKRLPISTVTAVGTYVDSLMLPALSSSGKTVPPSSYSTPYTSAPASATTPAATYVDSTIISSSIASNSVGTRYQLPESKTPCATSYDNNATSMFTHMSTYVDSMMLSGLVSSKNLTTNELVNSSTQPPYALPFCTRKFENNISLPEPSYGNRVTPAVAYAASSKRIRNNFPVNFRFNERSSTLCHPSIWSMPSKPIGTYQEATSSRSDEIINLQYQFPHLDINKLLSITIGDNLRNPSHARKNIGNNTFTDGQSNPSIITVFRISKSKTLLSSDHSSAPSCNSISTNTSFPWGVTVEDFFRIKNQNTGTTKSSSRRRFTTEPKKPETLNIGCGGYEPCYEELKKPSVILPNSANVEKLHPQSHYDDINMPSTSTGYYGYETFRPFAMCPNQNVSSGSVVEREKENVPLASTSREPNHEKPKGTVGKMLLSKSEMCSPSQRFYQCNYSRGKAKLNKSKKPIFRIFDFGRTKKR